MDGNVSSLSSALFRVASLHVREADASPRQVRDEIVSALTQKPGIFSCTETNPSLAAQDASALANLPNIVRTFDVVSETEYKNIMSSHKAFCNRAYNSLLPISSLPLVLKVRLSTIKAGRFALIDALLSANDSLLNIQYGITYSRDKKKNSALVFVNEIWLSTLSGQADHGDKFVNSDKFPLVICIAKSGRVHKSLAWSVPQSVSLSNDAQVDFSESRVSCCGTVTAHLVD